MSGRTVCPSAPGSVDAHRIKKCRRGNEAGSQSALCTLNTSQNRWNFWSPDPYLDDMAHTVSINRIFTSIQYNSEINQDSAVSTYFLWLFKSSVFTMRILMQRILTLVQNYYNIKNKHQSIQAKLTQILYFQFFISS
jgi:hypothetical protein